MKKSKKISIVNLTMLSVFCMLFVSCDIFLKTITAPDDNPTTNTNTSSNNSGTVTTQNNNSNDPAVIAELCPDSNHPHAIDMGLGVKWSCCNVGASSPWDIGGWYAWGETSGKNKYDYSTYIHSSSGGYADLGNDIAGTRYDAASANSGRGWRMPSSDDFEQLLNCEHFWTELNGIYGMAFEGPNGKGIFLPAAGYGVNESLREQGRKGYYWSSTQSPYGIASAFYLEFSSGSANIKYYNRSEGRSVRAVAR